MAKEKFDFTKPEDQKQFEALPEEAKNVLIERAHHEAKAEAVTQNERIFKEKRLADAIKSLNFTPEQIAHNLKEINPTTKLYFGKLEPGIFDLVDQCGIEHIFTGLSSDNEIELEDINIGGKNKGEFRGEYPYRFSGNVEKMIKSEEFTTLGETKKIKLVMLMVSDIGLPNGATTKEIYKKADEIGLDLCPAEVGPSYRLQSSSEKSLTIAMEPIKLDGQPNVFQLSSAGPTNLLLLNQSANPNERHSPNSRWIFSVRSPKTNGDILES